jgi:hypothetical protein
MSKRFLRLAILTAAIGSFVAIPAVPALAQGTVNPNRNRLEVPITGVAQNVGPFTGTFAISRFAIQDGVLVAIGQLNGTVTSTTGGGVRTIVTTIAMPVANAPSAAAAEAGASCDSAEQIVGSCDILTLVLGPLHLDLLGLVIDLNQVVLEITGTTGAGDLLGNLLCAITGLLDGPTLTQTLVNLLNQLIGVLAGL